ncbi:unnamed protein product [Peniophora sp. CBMAI 1063]|nr:unnamed protein product [Peniophora sp. CBMAI 1063]
MNSAILPVAGPLHAHASINRKLSDENLSEIFMTLSLLDIPSRMRPQGWYLQVNGVCRRWRYVALNYARLWATNAGSFISDDLTNLMIERARGSALCFDGHLEDRAGPGYVLSKYQLSLLEQYRERLRSFVYDGYLHWPELLYRLRSFPKLEMARIWDGSGPDMWPMNELIDTPYLHGLYMNNVLIPFNAPSLRYLRVDMDHINWRSSENMFDSYEPEADSCEAIPRVFPTHELIVFLQRSQLLERLIITDMPLLLDEHLPLVSQLHVELPKLRALHLGGKSYAMGDLMQRLRIPQDTQVFIDTETLDADSETDSFRHEWTEPVLLNVLRDWVYSPAYDSLRLGLTSSYDLLLQLWSSRSTSIDRPGGLDLSTSLGQSSSPSGPAFTLRLPSITCDIHNRDINDRPIPPSRVRAWDDDDFDVRDFENKIAEIFYRRVNHVLHAGFSTLRYVDYTDAPWQEFKEAGNMTMISPRPTIRPMHEIIRRFSASHVTACWSILRRVVYWGIMQDYHLPRHVEDLTIVNFPCAEFPSQERYNQLINVRAWTDLKLYLQFRRNNGWPPLALRLAESASDMSNMARSDGPEYHRIAGTYEDAVREVTQKGYEQVAPYVKGFEDLRIHRWP